MRSELTKELSFGVGCPGLGYTGPNPGPDPARPLCTTTHVKSLKIEEGGVEEGGVDLIRLDER